MCVRKETLTKGTGTLGLHFLYLCISSKNKDEPDRIRI